VVVCVCVCVCVCVVCVCVVTDMWHAHVRSGDWITHKEGMVATYNHRSGLVNTHLRLRYHAKGVYALMGLVLSLNPNYTLNPTP